MSDEQKVTVMLKKRDHDEHPLPPDEVSRRLLNADSQCRGLVMAALHRIPMTYEQIAAYAETTVEDVRQAIDKATT